MPVLVGNSDALPPIKGDDVGVRLVGDDTIGDGRFADDANLFLPSTARLIVEWRIINAKGFHSPYPLYLSRGDCRHLCFLAKNHACILSSMKRDFNCQLHLLSTTKNSLHA